MKPLDPEVKTARKIERLSKENSALRAANRKLAAGGAGYEDILDELKSIASRTKPFSVHFTKAPQHKKGKHNALHSHHGEIAVLVLSDWHISECVRSSDINGLGKYNSIIAANRVAEIIGAAKKVIALHRSMYPIEKIWVVLLGDFISGSIHQELAMSNDLSDAAATVLASQLLYLAIQDLSSFGIPIQIDTAVGNHPRMTPTMPTKRQTDTNFDWVAYEMLRSMLNDNKAVEVNIHTGQINVVKQYGWKFVIEHGYGIRHGREEDAESRLRAMFDDPAYRSQVGHEGTSFDCLIIGDQHRPKVLANTIVNGSLVGCTGLTTAWRLQPIRACQQMFGISSGHTRTWHYALDATDVLSEAPNNAYSKLALDFMEQHKR